MIIPRREGEKLLRNGKAQREGICNHDGRAYVIITRFDKQRTDHYPAGGMK